MNILTTIYVATPTVYKYTQLLKSECYSWSCLVFCIFGQLNCQIQMKKFIKDGFKVYHFSSISMQRKRDLARAVHNRKNPQRHLLEKNGTCKFFQISQEFPEKYSWEILGNFLGKNSWEILRNFSKLCLLFSSPKNP